ncbi:LacI family DNA-binding transcriptional regulator [Microbacterium sp. M1A1_1b]
MKSTGGADRARAVNMADVARVAGVSAQTVSRALRGAPNVSPDAQHRVEAAVEQLGYRLNNAARALSSGRSRTLGLVLLQSGGYYSRSAVTAGVESAAESVGLAVNIVTIAALDTGLLERALMRLSDQGAEGIVIAVPLLSVTRKMAEITSAIPTVAIDGSQSDDIVVLGIDQRAAGRLATEHLLGLGHGQVWHLSGPEAWIEARQRREGWQDALRDAGVDAPPPLEGDWSPESGRRLGQVLSLIADVTAVFVGSDEMAFGLMRAMAEAGRRVPDDVSIVSVDDIPLAPFATPPLTTVRQDFFAVGADAVRTLVGGDARPGDPSAPQLVVRASTAPRPAR